MTYALLWGLQDGPGIPILAYPSDICVILIISGYVDISPQYLFLDSDHSSGRDHGEIRRLGWSKYQRKAALLTQPSYPQDTQAKANSSSPENSSFLSTFYHRYKVSKPKYVSIQEFVNEKENSHSALLTFSTLIKVYNNIDSQVLSVGLNSLITMSLSFVTFSRYLGVYCLINKSISLNKTAREPWPASLWLHHMVQAGHLLWPWRRNFKFISNTRGDHC